jgi:hypothetical protein
MDCYNFCPRAADDNTDAFIVEGRSAVHRKLAEAFSKSGAI